MAFTTDQILDLVTTTQAELGRLRWTDIASDIQEHFFLPQILKKERVTITSGDRINRNLQVGTSGASKWRGMFGVDKVNVGETMKVASVPWRHATTNYTFDRVEVAINRNPAKIVDLVKTRRSDCMVDLADLMETTLWTQGPLTASDELTPYGVLYWLPIDVTQNSGKGGFSGALPTNEATSGTIGGIDPSVYTRWRHWAFQTEDPTTTGYTKDVTVKRMRTAFRKTSFKSPHNYPNYARGRDRCVIYVNEPSIQSIEEIAERQNENLGKDIASMDDRTVFKRCPIEWVPQLDNDTRNPMFFINWSCFHIYFLEGEYMREERPEKSPNQHTVFRVFIDCTFNTFLVNRRKCAIGATSA